MTVQERASLRSAAKRLRTRTLRAERRDVGVCPDCGGPLAEGKTKCRRCLRISSRNMKQKRTIRLFRHVCVYCAGELDDQKLQACTECLDKRRRWRARKVA